MRKKNVGAVSNNVLVGTGILHHTRARHVGKCIRLHLCQAHRSTRSDDPRVLAIRASNAALGRAGLDKLGPGIGLCARELHNICKTEKRLRTTSTETTVQGRALYATLSHRHIPHPHRATLLARRNVDRRNHKRGYHVNVNPAGRGRDGGGLGGPELLREARTSVTQYMRNS